MILYIFIYYKTIMDEFEEFYSKAMSLSNRIKAMTMGQSALKRVLFARNYIDKETLKQYIYVGFLSKNVVDQLNTSTPKLKFSIDNFVKNLITHSDVLLEDYLQIPKIAENPSKILMLKNGYDIILFQENEKYYKLVVKTTKSKNENFVKSFHLLREKRYNKYM